ncbi:MAG TPA: hypothetical protein PLD62_08875, partial [Candidatus Cloacimonadota bacterium]|nr:hypothetical protein [Candidatus Cloacimonadota bacterium]
LIISTITVYDQMKFIRNKDLGFTKDFIVSIPFNQELQKSFASYKNTLLQNPNILGVTSSSFSPANVGNVNPAIWEGKTNDDDILFNFIIVEKDFLNVFDMKLVQGSNFFKDYQEGDPVPYIVNETAVKIMGLDDPVGKKFAMWSDEYGGEIIGVVKDYNFHDLTEPIGPIMMTTLEWFSRDIFVKIAPQNVFDSMEYIKKITTEFSPGFPYRYSFLDNDIEQTYSQFYNAANIIKYFAVLAVFISCLGLFGLASFMTEQRTKEIGIRKVLGSSVSKIVFLLTSGFSRWVLLANVFAWMLAYFAMQRFLNMFAYKISLHFSTFILSGLIALFISFITVSYQTIKAANANPVESLKYE